MDSLKMEQKQRNYLAVFKFDSNEDMQQIEHRVNLKIINYLEIKKIVDSLIYLYRSAYVELRRKLSEK